MDSDALLHNRRPISIAIKSVNIWPCRSLHWLAFLSLYASRYSGNNPMSNLPSSFIATPLSASQKDWQRAAASDSETSASHVVYTKEIHKSPNDDRVYRLIQLENGLQALLIHDPTADKAAACLDVGTGFLMDPVGITVWSRRRSIISFLG